MEIFRELQSNSDGIMVIRYSYMQMIRFEDIVCVYTDRPYHLNMSDTCPAYPVGCWSGERVKQGGPAA